MECLVGDLITKPPNANSNSNSNIPAQKSKEKHEDKAVNAQVEKEQHIITEQLEDKKKMAASKNMLLTFREPKV